MNSISGRVGSLQDSQTLDLRWDGKHLVGTIDSAMTVQDLELCYDEGFIRGSLRGRSGTLDFQGREQYGLLSLRFGFPAPTSEVTLNLKETFALGFYEKGHDRQEVDLSLDGSVMRGRIGGLAKGLDVDIVYDTPSEVALLAAVLAYLGLEEL